VHDQLAGINCIGPEALNRFVYLVGSARGGTSVLQEAFGVHDELLVLPGPSHLMNQVWRYRNKIHDRLFRQVFRLPSYYREEQIVQSLGPEKGSQLKRYIDQALITRDLRLMYQLYPLVYSLDKECGKDPQRLKGWVDKANDVHGLEAIPKAFPESRFVFIVRDPRGAVASLAKRSTYKATYAQGAIDFHYVASACIHWRYMMHRAMRFAAKYPHRSMLVRFEDFVREPARTLGALFHFAIGAAPSEEIIQARLAAITYGESAVGGVHGKGVRADPVERWKQILDESQIDLVSEITRVTAQKLGYDLPPPRQKLGAGGIARRFTGAKSKVVTGLKLGYLAAWERLLRT
jgi:hypothetical protein